MYTFLILIAVFFLIAGAIYKGNIRQNTFAVMIIVVCGTFVGSVIVNGIGGMKTPYTKVIVDSGELESSYATMYSDDTTYYKYESYIQYRYDFDDDELGKVDDNRYTINEHWDSFYGHDSHKLTISFLPEGDTVPYYNKYRQKRLIDSKWISSVGMPRGKTTWEIFIPNDEKHIYVINFMNQNFFHNEENEEIAQSN